MPKRTTADRCEVIDPAAADSSLPGAVSTEAVWDRVRRLLAQGCRYLEANDLRPALSVLQDCLKLAPDLPEAWFNLALTLHRQGDLEKARHAYHKVLGLNPEHAGAMGGLGLLEDEQNQPRARIWFSRAIRADAGRPAPWVNLGNLLRRISRPAAACRCLEKAVQLAPGSEIALCNLGNAYRDLGRLGQAEACYRRALELKPDFANAHFNLAVVLLQQGRMAEGWPHYQWRLKFLPPDKGYPKRYGLDLWCGQNTAGKGILVYDEQGFGDVLLFARYLPLLKDLGARVVLETRAELQQLFRRQPYLDQVLDRNRPAPDRPNCHWCTPIASLPMLFGTKGDNIPARTPYITADARRSARAADEIECLLAARQNHRPGTERIVKVGLTWQTTSAVDRFRSIGIEQLAPLAGLSRRLPLAFFGLQKDGCHRQDYPQWIIPLDHMLTDFDQTAAVVENLDLVITIDTAVAHLAGSMASQVWVMLPKICDWRWFLNTDRSPWYPTMRLFRQARANDWQPVLKQVAACLKNFVSNQRLKGAGPNEHPGSENPRQLFQQAVALEEAGQRRQAIRLYSRLAAQDSEPAAAASYNLGLIMLDCGDAAQAAQFFSRALESDPQLAQAANNLGCALEMLGRFDQARAAYKKALEIDPAFSEAAFNLGRTLMGANRLTEAARAFRLAVEADPGNHRALNNLGAVLHRLGRLDQALATFRKVLALKPDFAKAHQNLGNVYLDLDNPDRGIACHARALEIIGPSAEDHVKQAQLCLQWLKLSQAEEQLHRALEKDPGHAQAHTTLGTLYLLKGDFNKGWQQMRWRFALSNSRNRIYPHQHSSPLWRGEPLSGRTILVHCEQGHGDTIQFIRYLPLLTGMGARVIAEVQPSLVGLVAGSGLAAEVVALGKKPYDGQVDFHVPLMDLPLVFNTGIETIPHQVPYLRPPQDRLAKWRRRLDCRRLKVGLVWQGSPTHPKDSLRSMQLGQLAPLLELEAIAFYSLQKSPPGRNPAPEPLPPSSVIDLGPELGDFADTAAVVSLLDLVISVDTAVAHLAGALAQPVWVMLPFCPDWRWLLDRSDSPWYPGMRLFRQHRPEDWSRVIERLKNNLENLVRQRRNPQC